MKVLIACEFSGIVRDAFIAMGHDAVSCDLLPTERSGPHYQGDVFDILGGKWDMMIAFPPCTYLCNSGVHWLHKQPDRMQKMADGASFFNYLLKTNHIKKKVIENSIPHKYAVQIIGRKYDQIIQPHQFGHPESKATCLWLEGVDPLVPTKILTKPACGYWENQTPSGQNKLRPSKDRAKLRGTTYQGIADAMAIQWGLEL